MNGRFLLDTNIIIALFAKDPRVHERISNASELFIPGFVMGDLYFGAYGSSRIRENLSLIDEFGSNNVILFGGLDTAKRYGDIKSSLKEKGEPIPENDIWIAAIAQEYDLTLVTRDGHFNSIDNLKVEEW